MGWKSIMREGGSYMNKKFLRHFLSVLLVLTLCCMAGLTAFAAGTEIATSEPVDSEPQIGTTLDEAVTEAESEEVSDDNSDDNSVMLLSDEGTGESTTVEGTSVEDEPEESNTESSTEASSEEMSFSTEVSPASAGSGSAEPQGLFSDSDEAIKEIIEAIREEYDDDTAAAMERMLNSESVKELSAAMEAKMQEQFGDKLTEEFITIFENMDDAAMEAWMEEFMSDENIVAAFDKVLNDESLAEDMDILLAAFFGDFEFDDDFEWTESPDDEDDNSSGTSDSKKDTAANSSSAAKDSAKKTNAGNAGSATNGSQNTPDTGDTVNPYIFLVLMVAAVVCGGLIIFKVRKNKSR